ncbi:MAG: nitronate monooxygenase [Alphaproteobacteria bacterium]|nr:nitronate monooxygenase [Alphaproteobacteria bacterium]
MYSNDEILDRFWKAGREFLNTRYAIMGGAMSWVSEHNLVAAISNAGGFGVIAGGAMPPELLKGEIEKTKALTKNSFGVNLITMHPQLDALMDVCIGTKVGHVILAGGIPSGQAIKKLKDAGIKVLCFAPALVLAKRLVKAGTDALILEGTEAGGHIGPVATNILVQEIVPYIKEVPVFVAGGIGSGEMMAAFLSMGVAGCQLGTRFVCTTECIAHPNFKKAFIHANARDAMPTVQIDPRFPVIPVRAITNEGTKRFMEFQMETIQKYQNGEMELKDAQMAIENYWGGALRRAVIDGDVENGSLMAGQSVGLVKEEKSVQAVIDELVADAAGALRRLSNIPA